MFSWVLDEQLELSRMFETLLQLTNSFLLIQLLNENLVQNDTISLSENLMMYQGFAKYKKIRVGKLLVASDQEYR